MSRLIFDADTLGGTTTLSSADAVGNFTLTVPAVNGTLSVKDASDDATFRNITLTGAVLAGAWNGSTITVPYGGTGATTLTGYIKGNGTSAMTGVATIPNTDITGLGTMSTQGSDAVTITGGTANGLTIGGSNPAAGTFTTLRFNSTLSVAGTTGTAGQVLTSNGASAPTWQSVAGVGTVTSVDGSGGTTGLTLTGGPITASGTLTLGGTLAVANGGTGATTDSGARTALGLGTMAVQAASSVAITGGSIDGTTVGSTTVAAGSFTTLNSSGATRLGGLSGNQSLQVNNVASAVNYAQIVGAIAGAAPTISAAGSDANIGLVLSSKGSGVVALGGTTAANSGFRVNPITSSVNYIQVNGNTAGNGVNLQAEGTDGNIQLSIRAKGTSNMPFFTGGGTQITISNTASAVNRLDFTGAATGAAPTISAQGSDANIGLVLTGKGTGVVALGGSTVANSGLQVFPVASAVNYLYVQGNVTGNTPIISAQGTDTNLGLAIRSKGAFNTVVQSAAGANIHDFAPTASSVNYLRTTPAVTTGAPSISAIGSDANINILLTPKGTGTVQYGTYTAGIIAQAGFITITDAGGTSRRLLVG